MTEYGLAPFGPTRLNAGMVATHLLAQNCPDGLEADKWAVLRHCITAKKPLNVSDRALTVLSALLSCYPETELRAGDSLIVFPSNRELARRAHGISEPTLRRALGQLVAAGLISRRDSPNGKRYARRNGAGEITRVFGFDLKPLLAQAARVEMLAADMEAARRQVQDLREQVTLLRRDLEKSFALAEEQGRAGRLKPAVDAYNAVSNINMRSLSAETLASMVDDLDALQREVTKQLRIHINSSNMSGNTIQNERHKQDSNPNLISESEGSRNQELEEISGQQREVLAGAERLKERATPRTGRPRHSAQLEEGGTTAPDSTPPLQLASVLEACPDVMDYTTQRIQNWSEFIEAGKLARGALGISPSAWQDATMAMGPGEAAVTVATILQRHAEINSPGGYLRALTAKAQEGKFTPKPIVQALLRRKLDEMAGVG